MSKNAQILLESLIEQEFQNNDNYSYQIILNFFQQAKY